MCYQCVDVAAGTGLRQSTSATGSEHRPRVSVIYTDTGSALGDDFDDDDDDNDEYCSLTIGII